MRISDWSSDVCSSDLALRASGRVYPAYETAQELDLKRKIQLGRGLPPIYDRAALGLSDADRARFEAEGIKPHWRFRLDHDSAIEWDDLIRGPQHFDPSTMTDPLVRPAGGSWPSLTIRSASGGERRSQNMK